VNWSTTTTGLSCSLSSCRFFDCLFELGLEFGISFVVAWPGCPPRQPGLAHEPSNMPKRVLYAELLFHVVVDKRRKPCLPIVAELFGGVMELLKENVSLFLGEFRWPS